MTNYTPLVIRVMITNAPCRELDAAIHEAFGFTGYPLRYTGDTGAAETLVSDGWNTVLRNKRGGSLGAHERVCGLWEGEGYRGTGLGHNNACAIVMAVMVALGMTLAEE